MAKFLRVVIRKETLEESFVNTERLSKYEIETNWQDLMSLIKPDNYNDKENDENLFFIDLLRQDNELTDLGDEYYEWLKSFRVAIVEGLNRYSKASDEYQSMRIENRIEADKVLK